MGDLRLASGGLDARAASAMSASSGAGATPLPSIGGTERCGNRGCDTYVTATDGAGLCSGCRTIVYCSTACQKAHWKNHKVLCKEIQRQRATTAKAVPTSSGTLPPFVPTLAAARAGDASAQYKVGAAYATGTGVAQSWPSAFEWFLQCTVQAAPPREVWRALGECYQYGHGVAKDEAEAVRLYRLGAAAGDAGAQFYMALCLERAIGVPTPDFDAALELYMAAAEQDLPEAMLNLGACLSKGRGVACNTPLAIALFKRLLVHPRAAPRVVAAAAYGLGVCFGQGADGVPRDTELFVRYMRQAAALGHDTAARALREARLSYFS